MRITFEVGNCITVTQEIELFAQLSTQQVLDKLNSGDIVTSLNSSSHNIQYLTALPYYNPIGRIVHQTLDIDTVVKGCEDFKLVNK